MSDEKKTILERLAEAAHSGDLSHKPRTCDVDYLTALGAAGARNRHGSALLDLDLTLEAGAMLEALKRTTEIVRQVCAKRGWPLTPMQTKHIAKDALRHYLKPACSACKGRGMLGVERDLPPEQRGRIRPCDACGGSGKEPLPRRYQRELRAVLAVMEQQRHNAGAGVRRKMRVRADVE